MSNFALLSFTSVLEARQWHAYAYQPCANQPVVLWSATNLPMGMQCDVVTGLISGIPTRDGVYAVEIVAQNAASEVARLTVPFRIEAVEGALSPIVEISVDVSSGAVTGQLPVWAKEGDDLFLCVRFLKKKIPAQPTISALSVWVKADEMGEIIAQSSGYALLDPNQPGVYLVALALNSSALTLALSDYGIGGRAAVIPAICEIEWLETTDWGLSTRSMRHTSQTFLTQIEQRLRLF